MKELFIAWLMTVMIAMSPLDKAHVVPEAQETEAQAQGRYQDIATAVYEGTFEEDVKPVFQGDHGRTQTALLVLTVFYTETGFRRDLDLGTSRERLRSSGLNDFGRSWCMGQINIGRKVVDGKETSVLPTVEGWRGPELYEDRRKCVVSTINALRRSRGACRSLPIQDQLAMYASGNCSWQSGRDASRSKMSLFFRMTQTFQPVASDTEVLRNARPAEDPLALQP